MHQHLSAFSFVSTHVNATYVNQKYCKTVLDVEGMLVTDNAQQDVGARDIESSALVIRWMASPCPPHYHVLCQQEHS